MTLATSRSHDPAPPFGSLDPALQGEDGEGEGRFQIVGRLGTAMRGVTGISDPRFLSRSDDGAMFLSPTPWAQMGFNARAEPHGEVERAGSAFTHASARAALVWVPWALPLAGPSHLARAFWCGAAGGLLFSFRWPGICSQECRHGRSSGKHNYRPLSPVEGDCPPTGPKRRTMGPGAGVFAGIPSGPRWPHGSQLQGYYTKYLPALKRAQTSPHRATG